MSTEGSVQQYIGPVAEALASPISHLLQAGAAGAMIGGAWTAFADATRVRGQQISWDEAMRHTVRNAAIGAGAGVLVGAAASIARTHPLVGVVAVLAAGAGALYFADRGGKGEPAHPAGGAAAADPGAETAAAEPRPRRRAAR